MHTDIYNSKSEQTRSAESKMTQDKVNRIFYITTAILMVAVGIVAFVYFTFAISVVAMLIVSVIALMVKSDVDELGSDEVEEKKPTRTNSTSYRTIPQRDSKVLSAASRFVETAIAEQNGIVNSNDLLAAFGLRNNSDIDKILHKVYLDRLILELRRLGYGVIPNYEHGHKRLDYNEQCVLHLAHSKWFETIPPMVHQCELYIKLFAIVLNGQKAKSNDIEYIVRCVNEFEIAERYNNYLKAYLLWLQLKKQSYDKRTKDEVAMLPAETKRKYVSLLLEGLSTSGEIDNERLEALKKILPTLGVDASEVHSLLHNSIINGGLATIERSEGVREYAIRQPDEAKTTKETSTKGASTAKKETSTKRATKASTIVLDTTKLDSLRRQTQAAQELLSDIFIEEEETPPPTESATDVVIEALSKLLERDTWQRDEVQSLLGADVMLGSMLEKINDYAYTKVDDIVVEEDGDTIYVTTEYKEQLI